MFVFHFIPPLILFVLYYCFLFYVALYIYDSKLGRYMAHILPVEMYWQLLLSEYCVELCVRPIGVCVRPIGVCTAYRCVCVYGL